jgi:hypothetical protein
MLEQENQESEAPASIECFAQDPIYHEIDKSILKEHRIITVEDPQGFLMAESSSVIVSIAADVPVKQIIADIARPAMIIWDRVQEADEEETEESAPLRYVLAHLYGFQVYMFDIGLAQTQTLPESET